MQPIIYDVAVSLDGFISGPDGDVSKFPHHGQVVDDYYARLQTYSISIMGRRTYEFGYRFGMKPGQNPYPNMKTYVFSKTLECPEESEITVVRSKGLNVIRQLKEMSDGPIYLCGGGDFARSLLSEGLINYVRLKRAPILLGGGVRMFGNQDGTAEIIHVETKLYEQGYCFQEFRIAKS